MRVKELKAELGLPVGVEGIKDEDIPQMIEWAMKEANPLYPVPDIWDEDDFRKLIDESKCRYISIACS